MMNSEKISIARVLCLFFETILCSFFLFGSIDWIVTCKYISQPFERYQSRLQLVERSAIRPVSETTSFPAAPHDLVSSRLSAFEF